IAPLASAGTGCPPCPLEDGRIHSAFWNHLHRRCQTPRIPDRLLPVLPFLPVRLTNWQTLHSRAGRDDHSSPIHDLEALAARFASILLRRSWPRHRGPLVASPDCKRYLLGGQEGV